jgi:hypothetical protein
VPLKTVWRSQTDVLQCWPRTMIEAESMSSQGTISRPGAKSSCHHCRDAPTLVLSTSLCCLRTFSQPQSKNARHSSGAWSFPDCLEIGVPGYGSYTWAETQTVLSLWAVTSAPLVLGNDARVGRMQQRLVDLLTNSDLLAVNAAYNAGAMFAGGRIWTGPPGKEMWAKPLSSGTAAVVLVNRGGLASGVALGQRNAAFAPFAGCFDLHGNADAILAPCDDNTTASHGAQTISLDLSRIPRSWLGLSTSLDGDDGSGVVSCELFDILATPKKGKSLGKITGDSWSAVIPPHGSKFLRLSKCS